MNLADRASSGLVSLIRILEEIKNQIAKDSENIGVLERQRGDLEVAITSSKKTWNESKSAMEVERSKLQKMISDLNTQLMRDNVEVGELVRKKGDLKIENIQLFEANKQFKEYESKAWKVLGAKETELLDRETALEQRESLKPSRRSLLPPTDQ